MLCWLPEVADTGGVSDRVHVLDRGGPFASIAWWAPEPPASVACALHERDPLHSSAVHSIGKVTSHVPFSLAGTFLRSFALSYRSARALPMVDHDLGQGLGYLQGEGLQQRDGLAHVPAHMLKPSFFMPGASGEPVGLAAGATG